jgi:hypothetical protein
MMGEKDRLTTTNKPKSRNCCLKCTCEDRIKLLGWSILGLAALALFGTVGYIVIDDIIQQRASTVEYFAGAATFIAGVAFPSMCAYIVVKKIQQIQKQQLTPL